MGQKILIVEDEPAIARNLEQILIKKGYQVTGVAFDREEAMDMIYNQPVDMALLDINLGGKMDGIELGKRLTQEFGIPFIFITSYADESTISEAKIALPSGYVVKPFDEREIYAAIEIAWHNAQHSSKKRINAQAINARIIDPLTTKEFEILQDLIQGKPYAQIAQSHFISINTVNTHIKNIYAKLGVRSKIEALHFCLRAG